MATSRTWRTRIRNASKAAGTYQECFEDVIVTLSDILATRDRAREQYEATGAKPVVAYTNKGGATNIVKNPALVAIMDLDAQALTYWRDLGLTPKGLKAINDESLKNAGKPQKKSFADILGDI